MSYKNKFSAFVDGYTKVKNAEADRELREQEAERRSQEFEFRKRELERSEAEAKERLDLRNGLRDAANPEKDAGTITTGGTKTFTQAPDIAAGVGKIEADIAELEGRPAPKSEAGFGLRKTGEMVTQKTFNDPLYGLGRQASYLSSIGRGDEALKLNAAIDQERTRQETTAQTDLTRSAMKAAQEGGPAGFAAWYNSLGKPSKLRVIPSPSGKGQALVKEVDGMPAGQYTFESEGDFFNAVQMFADPSKAAANAQAQANARAASQAKLTDAYNTQLARNQANNTNGRTSGSAGNGSTSSAKPPPTQMSEILEIFKEQTGDDQKPLRVQAAATAEAMLALNQSPGSAPIPSSVIAYGALQAASNPASITPKLNKKTLKWENTVNVQGRDIVVDRNVPKEVQDKLMPVRADELFTEMLSANPEFAKAALGDVAARTSFLGKEEQRIAQQLAKQSGLNVTDPKVWAQAKRVVAEQAAPSLDSYGALFANSERAKMMFKQMNATKNTKQNMPGVLGWFN